MANNSSAIVLAVAGVGVVGGAIYFLTRPKVLDLTAPAPASEQYISEDAMLLTWYPQIKAGQLFSISLPLNSQATNYNWYYTIQYPQGSTARVELVSHKQIVKGGITYKVEEFKLSQPGCVFMLFGYSAVPDPSQAQMAMAYEFEINI